MSEQYGPPPRAEEVRRTVEERLREAEAGSGARESVTVDWRGKPLPVYVIDLPIEMVYYNPATHRIRAQRSHSPEREKALEADPWSKPSQDYLHFLLTALPSDPSKPDPEFDALAESLKEYGQTDPGLVTREGILVNGNTRRAALNDIGALSIRVGVLPETCGWSDISAVELSLQLRKDHRREYSYINRLLAIDELAAQGVPLSRVAREFRTTVESCDRDVWVLACIREMIDRSARQGASLRLVDFEDHQEKLRELARRYRDEEKTDREKADLLREQRMAAIVLGFSKTDVRLIEPDFKDRYLDQRLPAELGRSAQEAGPVAIPGLSRTVKGPSAKVAAARKLTDTVLRAKAEIVSGRAAAGPQADDARRVFDAARDAMEEALKPAAGDARYKKRKLAASDRLDAACSDIEQCISDLVYARASRSLDGEAAETFDDAVLRLKAAIAKLAAESHRSFPEPGVGVAWLLGAARGAR